MASYNVILSPSSVTWDLSQAVKSVRVNIATDESAAVVYQADITNKTQTYLKYTHSSGNTYIDLSATDNLTATGTYTIVVDGTARVNWAGQLETKSFSLIFTVTVTGSPGPIRVNKPNLLTSSYYYTGSPITIQATTAYWSEFNSNAYTMGGTTSATALGDYEITLTCKTGYEFTDSTTVARYPWSIINRRLTKPTLSTSTLYYSGSSQRITDYLLNYDSTTMVTSGQTSAINRGSYSLTVSCRTGYEFTDGTRTANYPWVITKRSQTISIATTSMTLPTGGTQSTAVTGSHSTIKINAIAPGIADATASGTTVTVHAGNTTGSANIYIYAEETDYYFQSNTVAIAVTVYQGAYSNIRVHNGVTWLTAQPYVYQQIGSIGYWRPVKLYVYNNGWKKMNEHGD